MMPDEKLRLARQLEILGVDIIEVGFPVSSTGEFTAVSQIARKIRGCQIAAIARARITDIDRTWEAVRKAAAPRIHIILPASDILLQYQLRKSRQEIMEITKKSVAHARTYTDNIEFSPMDATRTDKDFLCRLLETAIDAGAKTVNIADTVGYAIPSEFGELIRYIFEHTGNIGDHILSAHCHDDLGLAVANTLTAVEQGAKQVKCTINGIGERAGNAALEEVVMAVIRMNKINQTKKALVEAGISSMHARDCLGRGKGLVDIQLLKGAEQGYEEAISQLGNSQRLIPKRMISIVVPDRLTAKTVSTIIAANRTGKSGDGKIFVMPVFDAIRIRTGEEGDEALDEA
jgi:isopropylmalate/homocitrate/citramalate synthase